MPDVRAFPTVPLVGQPLEVLGWTLIVPVKCKCPGSGYVLLHVKQGPLGRVADICICPACGRAMHIQSLSMDAHGQLEFAVGFGDTNTTN